MLFHTRNQNRVHKNININMTAVLMSLLVVSLMGVPTRGDNVQLIGRSLRVGGYQRNNQKQRIIPSDVILEDGDEGQQYHGLRSRKRVLRCVWMDRDLCECICVQWLMLTPCLVDL